MSNPDFVKSQSAKGIRIDYTLKYSDTNGLLPGEHLIKGKYISSGRRYQIDGVTDDYSDQEKQTYGYSRHFTFIFNTFVMM